MQKKKVPKSSKAGKQPKQKSKPKGAPIAVAQKMGFRRTGGFTDEITVRGQLFLGQIQAGATPAAGDVLFEKYLYPGLVPQSPLVAYMTIYDKYEFLSAKIVYKGAVATTTDGSLFGWADHNALAPAPDVTTLGSVSTAHKGAADWNVWDKCSFMFTSTRAPDKQYYCKASANPLDYAQAILRVATPSVLTANKVYGNLYLEYVVRFFDPQLDVELSSGAMSAAQPVNDAVIVKFPVLGQLMSKLNNIVPNATDDPDKILAQLTGKVTLKNVIDPVMGALANMVSVPTGKWLLQNLFTTRLASAAGGDIGAIDSLTVSICDDNGEPVPEAASTLSSYVYWNDGVDLEGTIYPFASTMEVITIDTPVPVNVSIVTSSALTLGTPTSSLPSFREIDLYAVSGPYVSSVIGSASMRAVHANLSRQGKPAYSCSPGCRVVNDRRQVEEAKSFMTAQFHSLLARRAARAARMASVGSPALSSPTKGAGADLEICSCSSPTVAVATLGAVVKRCNNCSRLLTI